MLKRVFKDNSGFTLVEVLVALVVLAIGLLGLAGMQTQGLSGSSDASIRSQATLYSYDMAERMRANRTAATSSPWPYEIAFGATPAVTLPTLVKADLDGWLAAVATLPSGQGAIDISNTASGIEATISVRWIAKDGQQTIQVDTQL